MREPKKLTEQEYQDYAKKCVGNHRKFESFSWHDRPDDSDNFYVYYTSNRDSGLLDKANEKVLLENFERFSRTENLNWRTESHNHWACGYVDALTVRVYKRRGKRITREFKFLCEMMAKLEDYPVFNEEVWGNMEYEATLENIEMESYSLKREYDLPDGWIGEVFSYWSDKDSNKLESRDDQGGWLDTKDIKLALVDLGLIEET